MNIGIDFRELIREKTTGIGRFLLNFLEYAIKAEQKHNYYLYGNQYTDFRIADNRIIARVIPEKNTWFWDQYKLPKAIQQDQIDIFFSPYDKVPISLNIPKLLTVHDLLFVFLNKAGYRKRFFYNRLYLMYRQRMARSADKIITVSEHSKNDILKLWDINPDKITVIHNGISHQFRPVNLEPKSRSDFLKTFSIRNSYILYVGNFMPHKNVATLIQAYSTLPATIQDSYQLVLCGYLNQYFPPLKRLVASKGLQNQVTFTNNVSDSDLVELYNLADLFVFPSFYEGFGLPPLEAMACGIPVISSNASSLPEVLGDAAILCDPNDQKKIRDNIIRILKSKPLKKDLIKRGLQHVKEFSLETTARKLLETITELIDDQQCSRLSFVKHISANYNPEITCINQSSDTPEVSVIIPTLDGFREGYLPNLLDQLKQQSFQNFETIIIKGDPRQGRAINKGVGQSRGDIIIILDDDTQIGHIDLFRQLIKTIKSDASIGMVGVPNLIPQNASPVICSTMMQIPRKHSPMVNEITESDLAEHPCCAIPKKVFVEVGGENELIPRGVDPYLRMVIRKAGYKIVVIPEVYIHHLPSKSISKNCMKFFHNGKMAAYVNKYYPQFVIELPTRHNEKVQKKRSYIRRVISYQYRLMKSLLTLNFMYFLSLIFYLLGFIWGFIFLKRNSV
ncbi:glycosyltransferase [candidate division KSB1 bacterium]|nr:glycosyltransferase [candidate division KSB1 bacterium]